MTHCKVTYSANAGMALEFHGIKLLVDALHNTKLPGFSTLSSSQFQQLCSHPGFADPDYFVFTHCHEDHFSQELTRAYMAQWPRAELFLPEPRFERQTLLQGERLIHSDRMLTLEFLRLPHENERYADVPHYGLHLTDDSFHILIAGDCALESPILAQHLSRFPVDLAILDFPWLCLPRGRAFIDAHIQPKHLLICHLPFLEDDRYSYRTSALRAVKACPVPDIRLLLEPFQQEFF